MFFITKKYIIFFIILSLLVTPFISSAIPAKFIKIRYSKRDGLIRIVIESNNKTLIRKSKVYTSYSLVKISFPDYFVLESEEIETPLFEFNHKGKNLYFNIKELKWIKLLRLDNPPRLVLDAILEGKTAPPAQPQPPLEKKEEPEEKKVISRKKTIVLDPGHGGKDLGIYTTTMSEKDIVLDISRRLRRALSKKGIKVVLTRSFNKDLELLKRIKIARKTKPDIFISIHLTSSNNIIIYTAITRQTEGTKSYHLTAYQSDFVEDSRRLAEAIGNALTSTINKDVLYEELNIPIISAMNCAAILIELPGPDFLDYNRKTNNLISQTIQEAIEKLWE